MNCPLNLFLKTCLKLDLGFRCKLISYWCRIQKTDYSGVVKYANTCRQLHLSPTGNAGNDEAAVLLSPQEVTSTLRKNEFNKEFMTGSIKSYDSNQLASNDPMEDTRSEAKCNMTSGILMGVFDGHGGPACAQVISKRLFKYIAAALVPTDVLKDCIEQSPRTPFIETFNDKGDIVGDLKALYDDSFNQYLKELLRNVKEGQDIRTILEHSITKLDADLSKEVLEAFESSGAVNKKTLSVALSGAVACVSHIDGPDLYVANVGDCNAVLGIMTEENTWIAKKITKEHNTENIDELKRIWSEHPENERRTVIRRDRLLGELAPLRSLGDYRYKWPIEVLAKVAVPFVGQKAIPSYYLTPPYLTAKPDVFYHRLTPKDKFLIIASDGIWDMLTPLQAVMLVGEHMKGKVHFNPLKLPRKNIQLGDINELLLHRKESLKSKPKDKNAATHLIRHAIGGTEYGVDHSRLAHLLSLAPDVSRMFRDDMTVTVVYFDSEFLRQCPA
ncbi:hypothetical protein O0L34_g2588 [Tuta absoluta]|nr:hypothetical protein O0L34_g2588 [Tuta absoluta]